MMKPRSKGQIIAPEAYLQMVSRAQAAQFSQTLRSDAAETRAAKVMQNAAGSLREAVLAQVTVLEQPGQDHARLSECAHEIKGMADTAGLAATGRIAEGLCRYFEDAGRLELTPDATVVALHVSAIGRAARDTDPVGRMSDAVARELAGLAAHKLAEQSFRRSG